MVIRERKTNNKQKEHHHEKPTSRTSKKQKNKRHHFLLIFGALVLTVVGCYIWSYYITMQAYTPLSLPKAVDLIRDHDEDLKRLWGTYRSHLYFGLRTRTPESLLFGLLWFSQYPKSGQLQIRYTCEQGDNLPKYGWLRHDGVSYGEQEIVDEDFILTTEFIKKPHGARGGDWTARIKGKTRHGEKQSYQAVSLMFAVSNEGSGKLTRITNGDRLSEIRGRTPLLGEFRLKFQSPAGKVKLSSYLTTFTDDIYNPKDDITKRLIYKSKSKSRDQSPLIGLPGDIPNTDGNPANLFVHQVTLQLPFQMDVVFESEDGDEERKETLTGDAFAREVKLQRHMFDTQFEKTFQLAVKKEFTDEQINFAKAAFSNCIGGITYLHGKSKIISRRLEKPTDYWETGLYTGVPSRSFFPRGFLWDEGFHEIMIQKWDPTITRQVLSHWLDLLNRDGWIPREQILGIEARRKVPDEFVVQHNENANPPTFFLTIETLIQNEKIEHGHVSPETLKFLKGTFVRLERWFQWYNQTQKGNLPGAYRWHGRDAKTDRELNPKTLTSGLDDYPRASHPSDDERHVDLRCWIGLAAGILADISDLLGINSKKYRSTEQHLKNNKLLNQLHWSDKLKAYADYGNHTKFVKLEWVRTRNEPNAPRKLVRRVKSKQGPSLKYVDEFGYISLFPFLLKILEPQSPKLAIILNDMRNSEKLWTDYGLRSLSTTAPSYDKYNTEHDKPYWRGPIWMNINFLAVKALHYYANTDGPHRELAGKIYKELRSNLINNLFRQYQLTGYIWEQYDDKTGKGQGCYPFTGWSALINLIMAEKY